MTRPLFREDAYLQESMAVVTGITPAGGVILDQSLFYPQGGGQPGDLGRVEWDGGAFDLENTIKGEGAEIVLLPQEGNAVPPVGATVRSTLDWERRYRHMRIHTALHLLSVVIPLPVTGGAISTEKGRLDFNMPEAIEDKEGLSHRLNDIAGRNLAITEDWISDAELAANPDLVKTMSVKPPMGAGRVRLIRIGAGSDQVDLQPCGGTHVKNTSEIGPMRIGKVEKKGKLNRRVSLHLD